MKPWTYQKNSDTIGILTDYFIQQEEFMYKAIFFDLDGTLTESGEGITKSVQYALEKLEGFCGSAASGTVYEICGI